MMKFTRILTFCLAVAIGIQAEAYNYKTVEGDPMQTRIYTLGNGLKVYMSVNKEQPRLQANIVVRTGSRNDPATTTGLAHYLEHLMFKGTQKFGTTNYTLERPLLEAIKDKYEVYRTISDPQKRKQCYHEIDSLSQLAAKYNIPNEYDKLMSSIGSEGSNAFTSNDITCYVENVPNNEIENWAKVQSDRFMNMVVRGFHTELEAVYEEKNMTMGSDGDKEWAALYKLLYPTHPYGTQTTIGEQEHLKNPSIVNIMDYYHRYYAPNNVAIVLAGDFDPDKTIAVVDKYFGQWKPNNNLSRPEFAPQPDLTAVRDTTVYGQDASNLILGWKFKGTNDMQTDTLDILASLLTNGKAGLLDVLTQKMEVQVAQANIDNMHDYSALYMMAVPKQGQTLAEARAVVLKELDKLRKGEFNKSLLKAIIANKKVNNFKRLESNNNRASAMGYAFVNDDPWEKVVHKIERLERISKADIVAFANKYIRDDNFACVYKEVGEDKNIKKIEKPAITPIPANREYQSDFVKEVVNSKVEPIEPVFVDYQKELSMKKQKNGLELIYKQNKENGLFNLVLRYEMGDEQNPSYGYACNYLDYIGTDKLSAADIQEKFYELACNFSISQSEKYLQLSLSGLNDNLKPALSLAYNYIKNAKADQNSWNSFVDLILKSRADAKQEQTSCFGALYDYGIYGAHNPTTNILSEEALKATHPQELINSLKQLLFSSAGKLLYYGPYTEQQLMKTVASTYKTKLDLAPWKTVLAHPYMEQATPKNEIIIAPYDAKNIYMRMIHNENKAFDKANLGKEYLFNEYFGGGMNTIVFQELRETRGLAYNAWANYFTTPRKGHHEYFVTHIISQNDKMMDCVRTFHDILNDMPQNEKAFELAKQNVLKSIQASRTTRFSVISSYLNAQERGFDKPIMQVLYQQLPSLTLQDIVKFQKENIANKSYRYVILGDEKNLDMQSLEKIAPVKRLSLKDIFGY